ncbi:radical SAM protein [Photobacterium sp.]|uniref:radical SAM protein n=1 Tax=Photobacterium sp. TaxID=660 RepID=UPI00299E3564|nr:radical SAM protein [Photobacterium sp.]MDX1301830.1 radical SAM protein [Photobacterium sp.]
MNNYGLNKYVFEVGYDKENSILYNSINRATVLLEREKLQDGVIRGSEGELDELRRLGFFLSDVEAISHIQNTYNNFYSNRLEIIIELTEKCNMDCVYCYQSQWNKNSNISSATIDKTIKYIENCFKTGEYSGLQFYFFGGEPLLQKRKILEIYKKAKSICENHNALIWIHIDTNGVLLAPEFIEEFDNLRVAVSLTLQVDHDKKRLTRGNKANYIAIERNIVSCNRIFINDSRKELIIRYNSDSTNKKYLPEFFGHMKNLGIKYTPKIAYTHEHKYNHYKNGMSYDEFKLWNSSQVIDLSIEHGLNVLQSPSLLKTPCRAYYRHNIKIFADGRVGLCNGDFTGRKCLKINDIYTNPNKLLELAQEKNMSPFNNDTCISCREIAICGGKHFCRDNPCNYGTVDLEIFLRTYVKQTLLGNQHYFRGFFQE